MPYACVSDVPIGWEVYQQLMAEVGDAPAEGLVVHLVLRRPGGLRYVDVWESREARQRFVDQRIHPVEAPAGPQRHPGAGRTAHR